MSVSFPVDLFVLQKELRRISRQPVESSSSDNDVAPQEVYLSFF